MRSKETDRRLPKTNWGRAADMDTKNETNTCGCVSTGPCDCTCHGDCACHKEPKLVAIVHDAIVAEVPKEQAEKLAADLSKALETHSVPPLFSVPEALNPANPVAVAAKVAVETVPEVTVVKVPGGEWVPAPKICKFPDCGKKVIARGLCVSHYRQQLRATPLKPLRKFRNLVRLPMVIRVEQKTLDALQKRVTDKHANSMYDSTRQALEVGVMLLEVLDSEKGKKK